jgi:hypothetical protein
MFFQKTFKNIQKHSPKPDYGIKHSKTFKNIQKTFKNIQKTFKKHSKNMKYHEIP